MKVVVGLSAVLPFTGWPLLMGPWLLNSIKLTAFTAGDQAKMDRSFPSCTTEHVHQQRQNGSFRDGLLRSNRVWICCCSLMKSWLIMLFLHKICTRPIGRLVSQFYSSLGCFYPSGTTGRVVSSNTDVQTDNSTALNKLNWKQWFLRFPPIKTLQLDSIKELGHHWCS